MPSELYQPQDDGWVVGIGKAPEGTKGLTQSPQSPALSPWECSAAPSNDCAVRDQSFITTSLHELPKDDKWDFLEAVEPRGKGALSAL